MPPAACLQKVLESNSYLTLVGLVVASAPSWRSFQPPMPLQRTSVANSLLRAAVTLDQGRNRGSAGSSRRSKVGAEQLRAMDALLGISAAAPSHNRVGGDAFREAVAVPGLASFLQRRLACLVKAGAVALAGEDLSGKDRQAVQVALALAWEVERVGGGLGAEGGPLGAADRQRMMLPQLLGQLEAAAAREGGGGVAGRPLGLMLQQCRQLLGLEPMPEAAELEEQEEPAGARGPTLTVWRLGEARPMAEKQCAHCQAAASTVEAEGGKLQMCSGCRSSWYCSCYCQRSHWRAHKAECRRVQGEARRASAA